MSNLAQDWAAWLWVIKVLLILVFLVWIFYDVLKLARESEMTYKQKHRIAWHIGLKILGLFVVVVALFSFVGPGTPAETPSVKEDGHRQLVEKRPEPPPESVIKEEAVAKKDPYLKAVEADPKDVSDDANEYVKKAIERSK